MNIQKITTMSIIALSIILLTESTHPIKQFKQWHVGLGALLSTPIKATWRIKTKLEEHFHTVEPGKLYRSAQLSKNALKKHILKHGIKTVVNLRGAHPEAQWWRDQKAVCDQYGVQLFNIPFSAVTLTSKKNLIELLDIYDKAPTPMLIHCRAGVDRTGVACAIWCIEKMGQSNKQAGKQLSVLYRHVQYPAKDFLIKIWRGRHWLENDYDPAQYPNFPQPVN